MSLNRRDFIVMSSLAILAFLSEPNLITVEKITIKSKELPESFNDYKIVQLSDLHLRSIGLRRED